MNGVSYIEDRRRSDMSRERSSYDNAFPAYRTRSSRSGYGSEYWDTSNMEIYKGPNTNKVINV